MTVKTFSGDVRVLKPLFDAWVGETNSDLGIEIIEDVYIQDFQRLVDGGNSDLLVLENDTRFAAMVISELARRTTGRRVANSGSKDVVGFMGIEMFNSPTGYQRIANEHYFYVLPKYRRGTRSIRLVNAAKQWAIEAGCTHLILNASALASDLHDRVCKLYRHFGAELFETSFLLNLGE